ncbi:hypothetical protein [Erythrobacter sp.]|uniref:hypothetical protein n=1 Tax=Erythrobacter sp. TaxID=1042 RepID=UPI001425D4E7|nr:hypothetical protein [Erythrobacter sp.]QIQ85574.1 MAG: hypothetical protein G9473_01915 [Erythrobacter sp.]
MFRMFLLCCGLAAACSYSAPILAETRESYLARLRDVCAPGCLPPREALRNARKRPASEKDDIAAILDIRAVSRDGDTFRLHTEEKAEADYFDLQQFDFGMPEFRSRPLTSVNDITVEFGIPTLAALLKLPVSGDEDYPDRDDADSDILVEGERGERAARPTLSGLRALLRGRRIAVRGRPVLVPALVGARRDFRRKRLTIELSNADDLVILPLYDENGEPILDGPLEGLARP